MGRRSSHPPPHAVAKQLATILCYPQTEAAVAAIWAATRARAARCAACCWHWHAAVEEFGSEHAAAAAAAATGASAAEAAAAAPLSEAEAARLELLADVAPALVRLDAERMQAWLEAGAAAQRRGAAAANGPTGPAQDQAAAAAGALVDGATPEDVLAMALDETLIWLAGGWAGLGHNLLTATSAPHGLQLAQPSASGARCHAAAPSSPAALPRPNPRRRPQGLRARRRRSGWRALGAAAKRRAGARRVRRGLPAPSGAPRRGRAARGEGAGGRWQ
jgi:hypothetical protein